jgi:hypothetical protein
VNRYQRSSSQARTVALAGSPKLQRNGTEQKRSLDERADSRERRSKHPTQSARGCNSAGAARDLSHNRQTHGSNIANVVSPTSESCMISSTRPPAALYARKNSPACAAT